MKKLFSIVLMTAGLLVSANAAPVSVSTGAELRAAFKNAVSGQTIQLGGSNLDFVLDSTIYVKLNGEVTLDLNGHNLVADMPNATASHNFACYMIRLQQGHLIVKNSNLATGGIIANNTQGNASYANTKKKEIAVFSVEGSADPKVAEYSVLDISKEIDIRTPNKGKCGIVLNAQGNNAVVQIKDAQGAEHNHKVSFGAVINVWGKVRGEKYGVQISGNVNAGPRILLEENIDTTGFVFPMVHIYPSAEIASAPDATKNGNGVYCAGYAIVLIEGYVHGSNGVYVKSGDVTIKDAVVVSENTNYTGIVAKGSGTEGAGNAIVIESNKSYKGGTWVTITGDSKIQAESGYAIQDTITTSTQGSYLGHVTIEGGTLIGGDKVDGGIILSTKDQDTVKITNGNFLNADSVALYVDKDETWTLVTKDGAVVINSGTKPSFDSKDLANDGADYQWVAPAAVKNQDIKSDMAIGYFDMEQGKITVKAGSKLTVERLVMSSNAQIIVEAGAELKITSKEGIVSPDVNCIVLKAEGIDRVHSNMGILRFAPEVTSNKTPFATVDFVSAAYFNSSAVWAKQRLGIPTIGDMIEVSAVPANVAVTFQAYDRANNDWGSFKYLNQTCAKGDSLKPSDLNAPFYAYLTISKRADTETPSTITFKGNLIGNSNPSIDLNKNAWIPCANSYSGKMSIYDMLNTLGLSAVNATVYVNKDGGVGSLAWTGLSKADFDIFGADVTELNPLQPFVLRNQANADKVVVLDYEKMIWNPTTSYAAPRRMSDITTAQINLTSENGNDRVRLIEANDFSAEFDNGYDSEKFMNDEANLFVIADSKLCDIATDNLDNTFLGFQTKVAGMYTIDFTNVRGEEYVLVDLANGQNIRMTEGATYTFAASASESNEPRFQIVAGRTIATDAEVVAAEANNMGVYTIMGQFVGNDLKVLPAGIYVVNGVKVVK